MARRATRTGEDDYPEALRAQSAQDDAYKLQTMQYLRKYEAELQRKEKQLSELRQELQQAAVSGGGAAR